MSPLAVTTVDVAPAANTQFRDPMGGVEEANQKKTEVETSEAVLPAVERLHCDGAELN